MKHNILALFATTLLIAGCSGGSGDISGTGQISLAVTDAPVDNADAVVVTFTEVQLLGSDDGVRNRFILDTPQQIDLLSLQGSNSEFLVSDVVIDAGVYDQVRFIVDAPAPSCNNPTPPFASYITIDGVDFPLVVPSGAQSGLKVQGPLTVATGGAVAYTVDFDLRKSIAERGNTGCYNLRPVLRVVDNAEVGSVMGTVDGDLLIDDSCTADVVTGEGAAIYFYTGVDTVADDVAGSGAEPLASSLLVPLNDMSGDFTYEAGFLLAGNYTAALTCQAGDDDPETDDDIGFVQQQNFAISAETVTTADFNATVDSTP